MKVSVCMITYNHEHFIAQALDSILTQRVNFAYEIVIGEDCSSDRTREIVRMYQEKYPELIMPLFHSKNQGMLSNLVAALGRCRGEYVALLEGDDYWTDPDKLQLQVQYLDDHRESAICFHNALAVYEDGSQQPHTVRPRGQKAVSTLPDLLIDNIIPTPSVVFRNRLFQAFPEWFFLMKMGDWPLHVLNAQYGDIGYLNRVMAVYRVHSGGAILSNGRFVMERASIDLLARLNEFFHYRYNREIRSGMARRYGELALMYARRGDRRTALACFNQYIALCWSGRFFSVSYFLRVLLGVCSPRLYMALRPVKRDLVDR